MEEATSRQATQRQGPGRRQEAVKSKDGPSDASRGPEDVRRGRPSQGARPKSPPHKATGAPEDRSPFIPGVAGLDPLLVTLPRGQDWPLHLQCRRIAWLGLAYSVPGSPWIPPASACSSALRGHLRTEPSCLSRRAPRSRDDRGIEGRPSGLTTIVPSGSPIITQTAIMIALKSIDRYHFGPWVSVAFAINISSRASGRCRVAHPTTEARSECPSPGSRGLSSLNLFEYVPGRLTIGVILQELPWASIAALPALEFSGDIALMPIG